MREEDDDTTIGRGGWGLVVASGLIFFVVLRFVLDYMLFPSLAFALAIALIVLLVLHRLAVAVNRYDAAEAARQVRRIVPASALSEGTTRVSGIEGAQASPVVAVPVRPEAASPASQRPAATVTPLAKLDAAPIILPRPVEPVPPAAARPVQQAPSVPDQAAPAAEELPPLPPAPAAKQPAAKPKAEPKSGTKAAAGGKTAAGTSARAAKAAAPAAKPAAGFKGKAELKAEAAAAPGAKAVPVTDAAPVAAPRTKAAKPKASPRAKAAKAPASGLVRLTAPRGGKADDLKLIDGVGPALERLVNSLGFYHFDQIAAWTDADVALVDAELKSFKGRVTRDKWVIQAKILAEGGTVEEAAAAAAKA
ncbi:hypothetical protein [Rhodobacter calidifons]|uniref:Flap endonuclease-1-like 5' DNA nuclease n=1 Tax=Rhodobacter calidifons TaxID=2715277 RepID=A0ABX0G9N2_9RHOB|nr:hypothetical protein [Rhodobacter calidifons]NHB78017.1 hypothetical protein [Rhodobacter calidifons]